MEKFLARRAIDGREQILDEHLINVSYICVDFFHKYKNIALLLGLMHDIGKHCANFQNKLNGEDSRVDHSSISAIFLLKNIDFVHQSIEKSLPNYVQYVDIILQVCAFVSSCHHKGLVDMVEDEKTNFDFLLKKLEDKKFNQNYVEATTDNEICKNVIEIITNETFAKECKEIFDDVIQKSGDEGGNESLFYLGMIIRYFYSCLIDADRIDAEFFEKRKTYKKIADNKNLLKENFKKIAEILDKKIANFPKNQLNDVRFDIYNKCKNGAKTKDKLFNLNVKTGGGKTFSSFRFALERAINFDLNKIIYVVPYISIIEQNASEIKKILDEVNLDDMLLECHSNVLAEKIFEEKYDVSKNQNLFSNFGEPIIFTTMVTFLESVYGASTQNNRRFHNLQNSVIIFDEIQSIPINCIGLFNLLVKFLTKYLNTTVLLCSATQPTLSSLSFENEKKDLTIELPLSTPLVDTNYEILTRTKIIRCDDEELSLSEVVEFVMNKVAINKNLLFVVNTKKCAKEIFLALKEQIKCYHLSTNMCPEHRLKVINEIKQKLKDNDKFVLISTQLIEAGVDLDFECAIRSQCGLESIIQTAGRCNREGKLVDENGNKRLGEVYVVKLSKKLENLDSLLDIYIRQDCYRGVCVNCENLQDNSAIDSYFKSLYAGKNSKQEMKYKITCETGNAVDLLISKKEIIDKPTILKYGFKSVSKNFRVIKVDNQIGVLVNYGKGQEYINDLINGNFLNSREIQRYMVNVFENKLGDFNCKNFNDVYFSFSYDDELGLVENIEKTFIF